MHKANEALLIQLYNLLTLIQMTTFRIDNIQPLADSAIVLTQSGQL